ncbi:MAG TPA: hypothetical protein DCP90_09305 [Clostridiales bacterium]|nr:MAG: hypothetical protein A2Y22_04695 [Clostridiales bacterium GWD2_32_59]HAN10790.1 hypothetical protein [Clostridiales bacterium]
MGKLDIHNKKGFTFLELIAVLIIMSVLSLLAIPTYQKVVKNMANTNVSSQVRSILNVAESTAKVNLKKTKVRFQQKQIDLILMYKPVDSWIDEKILEVIYLDEHVSIDSEQEVIYDINGFPEENVIVGIKAGSSDIELSINKDGTVIIQDI